MQPETLRLQGTIHEIDRSTWFVEQFCRSHGIERRRERVLVLILEELITNTLKHGAPPAGAPIDVSLVHAPEGIRLDYRDHGKAFDPTRDAPEPDLNATLGGRPAGGLGWPLIKHYCSHVGYRRDGDRNVIELVVRIDARE